jgi:hypothetical protein
VGSRAGLDDVEKIKFLTPPGLELDHSVVQPFASQDYETEKAARAQQRAVESLTN